MRIRTIAEVAVVLLLLATVGASTAHGVGTDGVVHFVAAGDYAANTNTNGVLTAMKAKDPDLALALGDLSYGVTGQEQQWCDFVTSRVGAGFPFELISGNHESNGQNGNINDFSACLPNQLPGVVGTYGRQWYVDVPQVNPLVRFVMVAPGIPFANGPVSYAAGTPAYNWTAAAIDGAHNLSIPWVVVGMHVPCWSLGEYNCGVDPDLRALLLNKHVDLVLSGHEHLYQRTDQLAEGRTGCTTIPINSYDADCVVDSDNSMVAGAGTVWATVGTGGQGERTVNTTDPEAPYFAAWSGTNANPAHGFLDVQITATDLTAAFVPADGTFTDSFAIHRGPPPPNQPPNADFTSSASGLTASFTSTSTDDGTITGYAWDFGDGTTGSGPAPQHTYATAGTYTVTLTVTDDQGATGTATKDVTVNQPTTPTDFVTDTFNRTVSSGWGSADLGGAWTTTSTAANYSVASQTGRIVLPAAGATRAVYLASTTRSDTDYGLTLSLDKVPTGGNVYVDVLGRRINSTTEYLARLVMLPTGRINVQLAALKGTSAFSGLAPTVSLPSTISYAANTQIQVRMQVTGTNPTTLALKVWPASQTEPTTWQTTATDSFAALQNPGAVGLSIYVASNLTNAPETVRVYGLSARPTS
jgi:PKD repeat protein